MDRRSGSPGSRIRAPRCRLCDQTKARDANDRSRHGRVVPFKWVAGDTVYGVGDIEQQLRRAGKGYVLGVSSAHVFQSGASGDPSPARPRTSPGRGARPTGNACRQGPEPKDRGLHDWCYLELADLEAEEFNSANQGLWTRGLLIRRRIADGDLAFFTTWCPAGTSIETLVAVEGHRWAIEDSF